ncbi:MAG: hypothetical protein M1821_002593 [Bathelium mastoideum]|nr:MAG: hypothetical protein M1821_002593 [Bathelium mastoideum]
MDTLSLAGALIGTVDLSQLVVQALRDRTRTKIGGHGSSRLDLQKRRFEKCQILLTALTKTFRSEWSSFALNEPVIEAFKHVTNATTEVGELVFHGDLASGKFNIGKRWEKLVAAVDEYDDSIRLLSDVNQASSLGHLDQFLSVHDVHFRRIEVQLREAGEEKRFFRGYYNQKHTTASPDLEHLFEILNRNGGADAIDGSMGRIEQLRERFLGLTCTLERLKDADSDFEIRERQHNLEELQTRLRTSAGPAAAQFAEHPFTFPFVIPAEATLTNQRIVRRVRLDTGAEDNWIQSRILELAGIQLQQMGDSRTYVGAGGARFIPLGKVNISWYSENQATTWDEEFLVHSDLPFDVILGRKWAIGNLTKFLDEPVAPLIPLLNSSDYAHLQAKQKERRVANQDIIKLQKAQDAAEREEKRKKKAASQAATPSGSTTPGGFLTPQVAPSIWSRRSSTARTDFSSSGPAHGQRVSTNNSSSKTNVAEGDSSTSEPSLSAPPYT